MSGTEGQSSKNDPEDPPRRTIVGGRHGSPTVTIAFPFSQVQSVDTELRGAMVELADLVARLAVRDLDVAERQALGAAASALADELREGD